MDRKMNQICSMIGQNIMLVLGAVMGFLEPTIPFALICTLAVLFDCYTAWSLSRRVKLKHPGRTDGKFKSHHMSKVFMTLLKTYALIVLAFLIDKYIILDVDIRLANIVAGAVCFWQMWSMLENESSCNDAKWARLVQKILVDKTERHFDIDLSDLKHNQPEKVENTDVADKEEEDNGGNQ